MENDTQPLTSKHRKLINISIAANILAWIVFVMGIPTAIGQFRMDFYIGDLATSWARLPFEIQINRALAYMYIVLRGFAFWLLLKGVSLGLSMIIETDMNYRFLEEEGEEDE